MNSAARLLAAAAVLAADAALLIGWARCPTVAMRGVERLLYLKGEGARRVAVIEGSEGFRLVVGGRLRASTGAGQRMSVVLAQLPLLLAPSRRRVLLLGWGGGAAAASALSQPLRSLDVVEPSPEVVEASAWLAGPVERLQADPRLSLATGSFETFLRAPGPRYDVIICDDPPDEEIVRLIKRRLAPEGLFASRARLSSRGGFAALQGSLRCVLRHFPSASIWTVLDGDAVLLASRRPPLAVARIDRLFSRPAPAVWMRPLGLSYPATLLSLEAAGEKTARELAWRRNARQPLATFDDRVSAAGRSGLLLARYLRLRGRPLQPREYLEILLHPRSPEERPVFRGLLQEWVDLYPRDPRAVAFLCVVEEQEGHAGKAALLRARLEVLRRRRGALGLRREIVVPGK